MPRQSRRRALPEPAVVRVESLSHDGRGVARVAGKAVFIHGALPGEEVRFRYTRVQGRYDEGVVEEVREPWNPDVQGSGCAVAAVSSIWSPPHRSGRNRRCFSTPFSESAA